jgi:UDP-glucuronate 4-epimerase
MPAMPIRVLLTGSAGFIGQNVLRRFAGDARYSVWALDLRNTYTLPKHITDAANVTLCVGDAGTTTLIEDHLCDWVIHLAGSAGVRESDADPLAYIDNNVRVTTHLFEQARLHGVTRVVYASSSSAYGDGAPLPLVESDPNRPACSIYGMTKQMCETIAQYYYTRHGVKSVGLRFFTVYGPHGRPTMAVRRFAEAIRADTPIVIYGDGTQTRDFTCVSDIVSAILASLTGSSRLVKCDVFNVGAGDSCSVNELVELIKELLGRPDYDRITHQPRHAADVGATLACGKHIAKQLGFTPKTKLRSGVAQFLRWLDGDPAMGHL